ncbi:mandelate racemase/muconate lactonizing enzyme family protein [Planococcus shenhongbingii]|uniref:Dipeptide epimerase n=1 Tax=Planococcus shenhongbingii TaxID=3058398 RepID=A0ABT8NEQ8_9BACL|nr:dipeptide epimerase [Planococcus sp. N017]MDN7246157.1 dipeptide epimerase [Planococcus sp. N017]
MLIKKVEVKLITTPFNVKFRTSYGAMPTSQSHIIVKITDEDGSIGIGEASPLPFFTGESAQMMKLAIERELGPAIIGENVFSVEKIHQKMNAVLYPATGAKSAVDMALWDLKGKKLNAPVYQLLGGEQKSVPVAYALGEDVPEQMERMAQQKAKEGFQTIKVKVGLNPEKDIKTIKNIRQSVGEDVQIRVDANQGYTVKETLTVLEEIQDLAIEYMEQPVPYWNTDGLAEVRKYSTIPIMADESIHSIHQAMELSKKGAVDLFGIKLIKCAGITNALKIAHIAEAAGIDCVLISPWDTQLGTHAGGHLSMVFSNKYAQELVGPHYLTDDPFASDVKKTSYKPTNLPGFGVPDTFTHLMEEH